MRYMLARYQYHHRSQQISPGGAGKADAAHNRQVFDSIVTHLKIIPFSLGAAYHYGALRTELERRGTPSAATTP